MRCQDPPCGAPRHRYETRSLMRKTRNPSLTPLVSASLASPFGSSSKPRGSAGEVPSMRARSRPVGPAEHLPSGRSSGMLARTSSFAVVTESLFPDPPGRGHRLTRTRVDSASTRRGRDGLILHLAQGSRWPTQAGEPEERRRALIRGTDHQGACSRPPMRFMSRSSPDRVFAHV